MTQIAVLLFSFVFFTACTLVDPFVTRGIRPGQPKRADGQPVPTSSRSGTVSLDEAFDYAANIKDAYRGALRDQALLQSWLGIGLIPLTAAAIGVGARGHSPDAVLGMGLAGASAFGIGTWLYSKPYQLAWIAGIKAVTCAEDAVTVFLPLKDRTIEADVKALSGQIEKVERQVAAVDELITELAKPENQSLAVNKLVAEASTEVTKAKSLIASAETDYRSGVDLQLQVSTAGERLRIAIDKITDVVDEIIVNQLRDPQALGNIISGLGTSFKTFTTVPEALKAKGEKPLTAQAGLSAADMYDKLERELTTLRQESARLAEMRRRLTALVSIAATSAPLKALEGCGLKPSDVVLPITTDPPGPIALAKSATQGLAITGGVPPYHVTVTGPSDTVKAAYVGLPTSSLFNVSAAKDAQPGTYSLGIVDKDGRAKAIQLIVSDKEAEAKNEVIDSGVQPPKPLQKASFDVFANDVKGKSVSVAGGDPMLEAGKAVVPVTVESVKEPKIQAFTESAVRKAILEQSKSGISQSQVTIKDFAKVRADAQAKAKPVATPTNKSSAKSGSPEPTKPGKTP
jgi:predicted  nucleic acid-binding Zn-ribbon protein